MAPKRDIFFNFIGDSSKLERAAGIAGGSLDKVGTKTDRLAAKMNTFGKGLTAGVTLPIVAAFGVGFKSLIENEALLAQTQAVIDSTGGAAGKTAEDVLDLANELSNLSGAAHENIVEGQNMLLTFTNIRNEAGEGNDVFDQTTKALLDMSTATGQDMQSAAVGLGKALNDPIKGVSALSEVGVGFTDEQKEQIKVLQESGDVMGAQKIILGELETQFGGSAEAAGQTMAGSMNRLKNSFEEIARNMALILIPLFEGLSGVLTKIFGWFQNLSPGAQKFVSVLALVAAAVGPVLLVGAKLVTSFETIQGAYGKLSKVMAKHPYIVIILATIAIVTLIVVNWDKIKAFLIAVWDAIKRVASTVWEGIKSVISTAFEFVKNLFLNFTGPGLLIKHWDKIREGVTIAWDFVQGVVETAIEFVKDLFLNFTGPGLLLKHWETIQEGIQTVVDFFRTAWDSVVLFFEGIPGQITSAAVGMWDGTTAAFKGAINTIIRAWNRLELKIGGKKISLPFGRGFSIPTITLRTPNIQELHTGGIFRAPRPGGEGLAILKDRERVTPADRIEPAGGDREPLLIQVIVDGKVLAESLINHEEAIA